MKNIILEDFTKYKSLSGVRHSPDGKYVCFAVHEMDLEENKYLSNLWLYNVEDKKYFKLTGFNKESSFIWQRDSENILFSGMRNDKDKEKKEAGEEFTQFYKINIHGGEAQKAFRVPMNTSSIKEINEYTYLITAIFNPMQKDLNLLDEKEKAEELKKRKEGKDYEIMDEIPFWSNGQGFINKCRSRLYIYNSNIKSLEAISDEYMDVSCCNLNKDKTCMAFIGQTYKNKASLKNAVYLYDIGSKNIEQLTSSDKLSYDYVDFINGENIICTANEGSRYGLNENERFYLINTKSKEETLLTPEFETSLWNSVGSDCRYGSSKTKMVDGEYLYFITTENDSSFINRIEINGKIQKVTTLGGSVDGYTIKDGNIIFVGLRDMKLQELYSFNGSKELQITDFNEWIVSDKKVVKPEKISVETEPGVIIEGWILKPVDFQENKKYPGILDIHGGPKTVYGEVFFHEMQYWANEGYFVFFCNPRGSDGRDNSFADIRGKYGTIDYDDLMKFTDAVLQKYKAIDESRIGVTGGSYGGFMTNWIIGHTNRFKAAASQRSISNWISMFGTSDIGYYFAEDQNGATPWNNQEKLWEHSPLKYADRVKTPTLFIHSEEDYRCWLVEGIQMFTALKYNGVEARMCMFRGESHELSRSGKPKHRIKRLKEITEWFNIHLK
ncbi:MAG: peptidase prolyl oligopeptidase active site domain protein [Clostridiales bacterium]|nr:peptidase prolyl oligopeptidase active site domain protein [Clostridiales bacterium]